MKKILFLFVALIMSVMGAMAQTTVEGAKGTIYVSPAMEDGDFVSGTKFYTIEIGRNNCQLDSRYLPVVQQKKAAACDQNKWAVVAATGGYQFINKYTKKALTFASTANDAISSLTTNLEDANSVFEFTTSQNSIFANGYEVFRIAGTTDGYPNDKNNGLAIWKSEQALWGWQGSSTSPKNGDDGSKFKFTMVEELVATTYTISVVGAPAEATVVVNVNGAEKPVGAPFDLPASIDASAVTATEIPAYTYEVTVGANTITVTYTYNPYAVNYDKNGNKSGTDRNINSISLTQEGQATQSFDVTSPGKTYNDMTANKFTVEAGSTVTPNAVGVGSWYHGYVYVDVNNNGEFGVDDTELVSYTAYREGETGQAHNSAGTSFNAGGGTAWSDGVNGKFPTFVAPAVGTYRMRFKTDWNNINPGGGPTMYSDRGQIIDITLEVVEPAAKATVTYNYKIDGVTVKSVSSEQNIGDVVAVPAVYPFTTNDYDTEAVVAAGGTTVDITVTVGELPFEVSADFASATWQYWANAKYSGGESNHPYAYYDEAEAFVPMAATLDGSDAFKWAFVGNPITGFKIMNKAAGADKYLYIATASNGATPVMSETERTWELVAGSTTRSLPGTKPFTFVSDGKYINDYSNNGKVSFWQDSPNDDNGSNWAVFPETVDVTIGGAQYATLYSQYPVEVPEGVKAYTLALNNETGNLTATEVATIPARCGVVLEGAANNYKFAVKTAAAATSCLSGVFVETETPANCLTFAVEEGVPGFYSYTGATVAANKAYYVNASGSNFRISFDNLTSIISAAKENGGQAIFDLQGRRVVKAQNGLYIQNGKKVIR